jgi:hypothetical protein
MVSKTVSEKIKNRILSISKLSDVFLCMLQNDEDPVWFRCSQENGFFTEKVIRQSLTYWIDALHIDALNQWLRSYELLEDLDETIGVIAAGNLPLVGFHDSICVLLTGKKLQLKPSGSDRYLMQRSLEFLNEQPEFLGRISIVDQLKGYDRVIATGSNNTNRYFDYYFRNVPSILRKNRNSIAVLTGEESTSELEQLGHDVFDYFGLGCRNVSLLWVPRGYVFNALFEAWELFSEVKNHFKYFNNFEYHLAGYLVNQIPFLSNDWVILKEDESCSSPIGVVHFRYYDHIEEVHQWISENDSLIQCTVGASYLPLGSAQKPGLADYADGVDTIQFLLQ